LRTKASDHSENVQKVCKPANNSIILYHFLRHIGSRAMEHNSYTTYSE
jgi:hypothetical protein